MKIILSTVIFLLFFNLLATPGHSRAANGVAKVALPNFTVSLNGHLVDNQYREYPLLVYHDITYFPMTWYDSRLLGLETNWSISNGLSIQQSHVTSSYESYTSNSQNASTYTATIPASVITINGKEINNSKEEYPLLSFRDVTYFPLTWRFAHDEFGWDYQWSDAAGLSITSTNPQIQQIGLSQDAGKNDIVLFKGYYYFAETLGTINHIYRAPEWNPSAKEEIYTYDITNPTGTSPRLSFQIRDNILWFTYHVGGGLSGSNKFVKVDENGKTEAISLGHPYMDFRDTAYGTLIIDLGADNVKLSLLPKDQKATDAKIVGDPNLTRSAVHVTRWDGFTPYALTTATTVVGEDVYVLCSPLSDQNFIYRINLKTNKTDKIVDQSTSWFKIIDDKLYYVKEADNALYSSSLEGNGEIKLSDHTVSWFDSINGNVFYTTQNEANQFKLYKASIEGSDELAWPMPIVDVKALNGQLVCTFSENDGYGIVLLDNAGRVVLKVADANLQVLKSDKDILLKNVSDNSIKLIK
ncbi:DUF5050 domain-containing protein [Paenibacillus sp. YN15]|uniref:DUF5050 domain-containing protein n=1 Tax=Paenibacillus sp. YN15 TaxID=1742774 RepID=UPI00215B9CF7|nr:DUF5050 domain-containing protein [Paenibacillus sp. YN15]